jgi:hypothetical protein
MKLWTYEELAAKVERDLATEEELFVQPEELMGYFNEAVDRAEQEVLTLYEDYFLTKTPLTLIQGTQEYDLPSDIYANKIRRVLYVNGTTVYTINRIRDWKKFEMFSEINAQSSAEDYMYMLYNPTAGSQAKFLLLPASREAGAFVTIWHLRNANLFTDDDDVLDIPESANFVMQYVKVRVLEKEGHFSLPKAVQDLATETELLQSTLATMVPDADNEIEMDDSIYREMN